MTEPRDITSWLPNLLGPLFLQRDGEDVDVPRRQSINLIGATIEDNPDFDRTDIAFVATAGGELGEAQFHTTDGVLDGTPNMKVDPTTKEVSFAGVIHYPGATHSGTRAVPFTGLATNANEPLRVASIPVRTVPHTGVAQVTAHARNAASTSTQLLLIPYTYAGGTLTLGSVIDQTPAALVNASLTAAFATHDTDGIDYIDVNVTADGDTNWSGQLQVTMADTP